MKVVARSASKWLLAACTALAAAWCYASDEMFLEQLQSECRQQVERTEYKITRPVAEEVRVLTWYRMRSDRPFYIDYAVCWARARVDDGHTWILSHNYRWPQARHGYDKLWRFAGRTPHEKRQPFIRLNRPPTNDDISRLTSFTFAPDARWTIYDFSLDERQWTELLGAPPMQSFRRVRRDAP